MTGGLTYTCMTGGLTPTVSEKTNCAVGMRTPAVYTTYTYICRIRIYVMYVYDVIYGSTSYTDMTEKTKSEVGMRTPAIGSVYFAVGSSANVTCRGLQGEGE